MSSEEEGPFLCVLRPHKAAGRRHSLPGGQSTGLLSLETTAGAPGQHPQPSVLRRPPSVPWLRRALLGGALQACLATCTAPLEPEGIEFLEKSHSLSGPGASERGQVSMGTWRACKRCRERCPSTEARDLSKRLAEGPGTAHIVSHEGGLSAPRQEMATEVFGSRGLLPGGTRRAEPKVDVASFPYA